MFLMYFLISITIILNSFLSIYILKKRSFYMCLEKSLAVFTIMFFVVLWTYIYIAGIEQLIRIFFIFPIMLIISAVDAREKIVFDEDVICGIIIEIVISLVIEFRRFLTLTEDFFSLKSLNSLKLIFINYMWVSIHIASKNFFSYGVYFNRGVFESFLGMMVFFVSTYILAKVTKAIGMGDVIYFSLLGTIASFGGCIFIFFSSFMVCFLYCVVLKIINRDFEGGLISFTPFISIGFIIFCYIAK